MQLEPHPSQFPSLLETGHRVNPPVPAGQSEEYTPLLKGTGFSPYISTSKINRALAPEGETY